VLALLAREQSVLVWRQPIAVENGCVAPGALPPFCCAALIDTEGADGTRGVTAVPEGFRLVRTGQDACSRAGTASASPYVYLTTSGTTGSPKIVAYGPDTLWGNARNCLDRLALSASDRVVIPVALAHM
jgi:hypothetical protein